MSSLTDPALAASQLATLARVGEERSAGIGDVLFRLGDATYPFIAIEEGEVAVLDGVGNEIIRCGPGNFLGELNLLSGQTVFLTAVVTQPLRYIAVEREALRDLLFEDGALSDLVLSTFIARREALQGMQGVGLEIVGPRSSEDTLRLLEFARANRLPYSWQEESPPADQEAPLVRLPGGGELEHPSNGDVLRALGVGRELERSQEVDLLVVGAGPAGLAAAVYGASEGLDTLLHRRADLHETMSDYLIRELEERGVAVRDRSEIAELHGSEGRLEAVTLTDGTRLPFSFLFLFLGARPCTEWLGDAVARDADGFILTGAAAGAAHLLETSVPGIFAAGDVRSGSTKRCAAAVGEGSMAVQLVHGHLSAQPAVVR